MLRATVGATIDGWPPAVKGTAGSVANAALQLSQGPLARPENRSQPMPEAFRVTARTDDASYRWLCPVMLVLAGLALAGALTLGEDEWPLFLVSGFFAIVGMYQLIGLVWPQEYELVIDDQALHWGRTNGRYQVVPRSAVQYLMFNSSTDGDMATAVLHSGTRRALPARILGTDHRPFADATKRRWPEVEIFVRGEELRQGPGEAG